MNKRLLLTVFSILFAAVFSSLAQTQACGSQFVDNGGITSNYLDNSNVTYTICPDAVDEVITVTFTSFCVETNYDALYVYNGWTPSSPQISSTNPAGNVPGGLAGGYWGTAIPGPFTSSDPTGCLTFVFRSDNSVSQSGWIANVSCDATPTCPAPNSVTYSNLSFDSATISWTSPGSAVQWEILVLPSTAPAPSATASGVMSATNPYSITGLTADTSYSVYVRSVCSATDVSAWSNSMNFTTTLCSIPTNVSASSITTTTATIDWVGSATGTYEVALSNSASAPSPGVGGTIVNNNSFQISGLVCGTDYYVFVRSICSNILNSNWSLATSFSTSPCFNSGNPSDLSHCDDSGSYCFDLTTNSSLVLGNLNPTDYTIAYYLTTADAIDQTNPITNLSSYCYSGVQTIYLRITNDTTLQYQIKSFTISAMSVSSTIIGLNGLTQCDNSNVGNVVYDLSTANSQINSSNTLVYYTSQNDAVNETNPILNPTTYGVSVTTPTTVIYIREMINGLCDQLYSLPLQTTSGCNLAHDCNQANSLCSSLGIPFTNTHQGISGNSISCLGTTPNPTWFYLPVSNNGTINLTIEQSADITFANASAMLDVDYIVYGPFSDPVTPCASQLTTNNVVSCSYSASAVEHPIIPNAVVGQYYLLMTTNFSNQAGFIRINMDNTSTASIDCSGLRLNAFLDSNNNGSQDNGEQNFPLGQFHFDVNNGTPNHIISPSGVYNIYDGNNSNIYNLTYTIDPNYGAMFGSTILSYSNISVNPGGGMTTYNFPITSIQNYDDLSVTIVPLSAPRAGATYANQIVFTNLGSQTISTGTITYTNNPGTTIAFISQTGTTSTATGFTYDFSNLLPFETRTIYVYTLVPTLPTVAIGQLITDTVSIVPVATDIVPSNNNSTSTQAIIAAYDPNDKTESHGGKILVSNFTPNDYLYYTIRFENTGSISAINIQLNDVLDTKLDATTVKMIAASHNYTLDRVNNNLTWKFDNIQLPVSVADTEIGKGYVTFGVKPKTGYSTGDIIPNTASIYFDSNPAIITNTFTTEFVSTLNTKVFGGNGFVLYPNPATNTITISLINPTDTISAITIYDVLGKNIKELRNLSTMETLIDVSNLARGVYMVETKTSLGTKQTEKLIVK